jgi:hypothetical protein
MTTSARDLSRAVRLGGRRPTPVEPSAPPHILRVPSAEGGFGSSFAGVASAGIG